MAAGAKSGENQEVGDVENPGADIRKGSVGNPGDRFKKMGKEIEHQTLTSQRTAKVPCASPGKC